MTRDPRAIRFHAILTVLACVLLIGLAAVLEDANSRWSVGNRNTSWTEMPRAFWEVLDD